MKYFTIIRSQSLTQAKEAGTGLKTLTDIKKDEFVVEYVGEVVSESAYMKRMDCLGKSNRHFYFFAVDKDEYIDAFYKGNYSRFINHSCDPNCRSEKWTVGAEIRMVGTT